MTDPQPRLLSGPQCWQALCKASLEDIDRAIDDRNESHPLAERYRGLLLIRRALLFVESDLRRYAGVLDRAMRALGGTPSGKLPSGPDGSASAVQVTESVLARYSDDDSELEWSVRFLLADESNLLARLVPRCEPVVNELDWLPSPAEATAALELHVELRRLHDGEAWPERCPRTVRDLGRLGVVDGEATIANAVEAAWSVVEHLLAPNDHRNWRVRWSITRGESCTEPGRLVGSDTAAGWALLIYGALTDRFCRTRTNFVAALQGELGELSAVDDFDDRRQFASNPQLIVGGVDVRTLDDAVEKARPRAGARDLAAHRLWRDPPDLAVFESDRRNDGIQAALELGIREEHYDLVQAFVRVRQAAGWLTLEDNPNLGQAFERLRQAASILDGTDVTCERPDLSSLGVTSTDIARAMLRHLHPHLQNPATLPVLSTLLHDCAGSPLADLDLGEPIRSSQVWMVTDHRLTAFRVRFELFDAPSFSTDTDTAPTCLFPDRRSLGALTLDAKFTESLEYAWGWASHAHSQQLDDKDRVDYANGRWVRWCILDLTSTTNILGLGGPSAGVAFALALLALLRDETIAPDVVVSAALCSSDGQIAKVGSVPDKAKAAGASGLRALWLHHDNCQDHPHQERDLATTLHDIGGRSLIDLYNVFTEDVQPWRELWQKAVIEETALIENVRFRPKHIARKQILEFLIETVIEDPCAERARQKKGDRRPGRLAGDEELHHSTVSFNSVRAEVRRPVLLLGAPGLGKTTLLWKQVTQVIASLWARIERGERAGQVLRVPVVLPLGNLAKLPKDGVVALSEESLDRRAASATARVFFPREHDCRVKFEKWLFRKCERDEIELYLDAYDELGHGPREYVKTQIDHLVDRVPITLTSRFLDDLPELARYSVYHLMRLYPRVVREYVTRRYTLGVDDLTEGERTKLRSGHTAMSDLLAPGGGPLDMARTPLFLEFLCLLADDGVALPRSRGALVEKVLERMLRRSEKRRVARGDVQEVKDRLIAAKQALLLELVRAHGSLDELPGGEELFRLFEAAREQLGARNKPLPDDGEELRDTLLEDGVFYALPGGAVRFVVRSVHEYLWGTVLAEQAAEQKNGWSDEELCSRLTGELLTDRFVNTSRFFIAKLPENQRARVLLRVRKLFEKSQDRKILAAWARLAGELRMESDA